MKPFGYIGIDFGTSTSHFAYCNTDGDQQPQAIRFAGKEWLTTCVLWRLPAEDGDQIVACGDEAIETWMQYAAEEKAHCRLAFGFKPDLAKSFRARCDALAFLRKAKEEVDRAGLPKKILPGGMAVVIGVPAEIGADHKRCTADVAREAGFGEVEFVEEPLGALAFHLSRGDITPTEARSGVVVVDFGGGTLDVALVNAEGLRQPWGDPSLGGRLFDDLFYQWLSDQNRPLEVDDREAMIVWHKECRELKEKFSNHWRNKGHSMADFRGGVLVGETMKWLKGASVEEFKRRAQCYRPSKIARSYLQGLKGVPNGLVDLKPIDLLDRIRQVLTGGDSVGSCKGNFSKVILTGGSSHWPFMADLTAEVFGVARDRDIILSQSPETTIGSGLALYNVLKVKNESLRCQLRQHKPKVEVEFRLAVATTLDLFAKQAAQAVMNIILPRAETVIKKWHQEGGSLKRVEDEVGRVCTNFQEAKEADVVLKPLWADLEGDLVRLLRKHLGKFLAQNQIPRDAFRYIPEGSTLANLDALIIAGPLAQGFGLAAALAAVTAGIAALVLAAINIKIIIIAALAHPILAVILGIGALTAWLGLGAAAKEFAERKVKDHEFRGVTLRMLHLFMSQRNLQMKLAAGRQKAEAKLGEEIRAGLRVTGNAATSFEDLVTETLGGVIDTVIEDLRVLDQIQNPNGQPIRAENIAGKHSTETSANG